MDYKSYVCFPSECSKTTTYGTILLTVEKKVRFPSNQARHVTSGKQPAVYCHRIHYAFTTYTQMRNHCMDSNVVSLNNTLTCLSNNTVDNFTIYLLNHIV